MNKKPPVFETSGSDFNIIFQKDHYPGIVHARNDLPMIIADAGEEMILALTRNIVVSFPKFLKPYYIVKYLSTHLIVTEICGCSPIAFSSATTLTV